MFHFEGGILQLWGCLAVDTLNEGSKNYGDGSSGGAYIRHSLQCTG